MCIRDRAAPVRIEADEDGVAKALWVQPQLIGEADKAGRPRPHNADLDEVRIEADIVVVAIGPVSYTHLPIREDSSFAIKGSHYSLHDLLQDADLAARYTGGDCLVLRLCPSDYHHYCYIDDGFQGENHFIPVSYTHLLFLAN